MGEDTRARILKSALKLFSEKGYLGAKTKEIAKASGISEVTLFRYFPNKENLFISVLEQYSFLPKLKELVKDLSDGPLEESLKTLAKAFLQVLRGKRDLMRIMLSELTRYPEIIRDSYQKTIEKIIEELSAYFKNLQDKGLLETSIPSSSLARAFLGLFFSYFYATEIKGFNLKGPTEEELISQYVKLFLGGAASKYLKNNKIT
ncbi:MAG: TetR/AcrR family transcriptional regulator [Caldimicrobium sp.]|jgi:AcrR family transcriptional regulator